MFKKVAVIVFALLVLVSMSSCAAENSVSWYNGYLGLAINIPESWDIIKYEEGNLTETADESKPYESLVTVLDDYGDEYFGLGVFSNENVNDWMNGYSTLGAGGVFVTAHITGDFPGLKEYAEYVYKDSYEVGTFETEYGFYTLDLVDEGNISVNGLDYYKLRYEILETYFEEQMTTGYDVYVTNLNNTYLIVEVQYYRDDPVSTDFAASFLKRLSKI